MDHYHNVASTAWEGVMRNRSVVIAAAALLAAASAAAQQAPAAAPAPAPPPIDTGRLTAQQLGLSVFPAADQTPDQQRTDERACYDWATQNVGYRITANTAGQIQQAAQAAGNEAAVGTAEATRGAGVAGAARGAMAGAAVGAIAGGDAGEGAAIGAISGVMQGRRARRQASQAAGQQAATAVQQEGAQAIANFKRAMGACLEGKNYTVR